MKRNIILLISIYILTISCNKEELTLIDPNRTTFESLMKNANGVESLVLGIYSSTRSIWDNGQYDFRFLRSDEYDLQNITYENYLINKFKLDATDGQSNSIWSNGYSTISAVNDILSKIDEAPIPEDKKIRYKGELLFFRAQKYFDLVRYFGDVPLITTQLTIDEARNTIRTGVDKVYAQIIQDLDLSISNLPAILPEEEYGRVTKYAAMAYLAKVYMTLKDWSSANELLKTIINSNIYTFYEGNWMDIFSREDLQPQFYIFAARFKADELGNSSDAWWENHLPSDIEISTYGIAGDISAPPLSEDVIQSFEDNDIRKNISLALTYENAQGEIKNSFPFLKKFHQGILVNSRAGTDFPFIRFTDVVLMYAEVCNELNQNINEAIIWLNKVRNRAGLESVYPAGGNDLRLAIEIERQKELFGEGHRWFDLVRTGRAITIMNQHFVNIGEDLIIDENDLLFPIPDIQILRHTSEIKQNPGY